MKLTVSQSALNAGMSAVSGLVKGRTTLPILTCVLVKADADGLLLTTSNLDATIQTRVAAKVERQGETCLPAKRLADAARVAAADEIAFEVDDKNVAALKAGSSAFKIRGMGAGEFPAVDGAKLDKSAEIPSKELARALKLTSYAQCEDASRYVICGTFFKINDKQGALVATNGRRLSAVELSAMGDTGEFIVPKDSINELRRLMPDVGKAVIRFGDKAVSFEIGNTVLRSKLIEGNYPNYKQVIPPEANHVAKMDKELFAAAVARARVSMPERFARIKLVFSKNKLTIANVDTQAGESMDSIAIKYSGPELTIGCNPDYLLEFIQSIEGVSFDFHFTDEFTFLKFTTPSALAVIAPIRIK